MKHKLLIINDIGLSFGKVNEAISLIRYENIFKYENLNKIDELLIETLSHLQQALENLEGERN